MQRARGFTIVELLIVIVVVAILAALSYVGYTNISNRAYDSSVQSDLAQIGKKLELYRAEKGLWPVGDTQLRETGIKVSKDAYGEHYVAQYNLVYCRLSDGSGDIAVIGRSKSGKMYAYSQGAVKEFTGRWTGSPPTCADAMGTSTWDGTDRDWLFNSGAWKSYL